MPLGAFFDLLRAKPGVVVSGEFGFRTLSACAYRTVRPSSRLVVWATLSEHTERDRSKGRNRLRRLILSKADSVVVNGPSGARYIRSLNPEIELHVVHQATPAPSVPARPRPRLAEGASLKLLFVGQLIERKGLMATIPQLSSWTSQTGRRIALTVVGGGPQRAALEELARDAGQEVEFLGSLPYDEVLNAYADADALFFPSLEDEWGLVVNEALQAGRPVIGGHHAQAVQCLVHDGVSGVVFDSLEPSSVAAALDRLTVLLAADPEALVRHCLKSVSVASIDLMAAGLLGAAGLPRNDGQAVTPPAADPAIDW